MLQYASLKAVIQYLDANIRFEIYNRCPSIRKTERAVPLYINRLQFLPGWDGPNRIDVNSKAYSIGTIRVYPADAKIRYEHDLKNKNGGISTDLDRFGLVDYTSDSHLTPGDILVGRRSRARQLDDNQIDEFVRELEALNMLLELKRGGKPFILDRHHPHYVIMQHFENQKAKAIRKYVRSRQLTFLPYLNRRNNITMPFTTEVQMTVKSWRKAEKVCRYPGKKVYEVEKKLLTLFFGGRKHIHVKSLKIRSSKVLRFPVAMFFKIQHLFMIDNSFEELHAISKIVHPTSFPLETVEFCKLEEDEDQHAIVKSAKKLLIFGYRLNMQTFLEVATQKHVEIAWSDFNPEDYLVLARNWLERCRSVGTCFVFNLDKEYELDELMRLLKTELNAEAVGEQCLKVRINETSKLKIAYQRGPTTWRMQFKVIFE